MEWLSVIRGTIAYVEAHLLEEQTPEDVARAMGVSSFYLQKGFKIMTDYSLSEYVRNRRLYLAALDVLGGRERIIDLAYRYGYETPESFTKAFVRFHGVSPMRLKKEPAKIKVFLPLKIKVTIQGGNEMDYVVEKMKGFQVIGFSREFSFETSYREIPEFWDEFCRDYMTPLRAKGKPEGLLEETIRGCQVGMYGVCVDDLGVEGRFRYMIAGSYESGAVPEGMTVYEFPDMEWAKFSCKGPMPGALQSVNTKIFQEWLPGNTEYEIAMGANIEWYSREGNTWDADYESAIWIPVRRRG